MAIPSRVLVADDDHDAADSLVALLQALGHTAFAVYNGVEAVDACIDRHPDLAILDVQMPMLDGCAAARLMRAGRWPPRTIASWTSMCAEDEPLRSGADVFDLRLSKPPRISEIEALFDH